MANHNGRTTTDPKPHTVIVRVNEELKTRTERYAAKYGMKTSEVVRKALEEYLAKR